jgi:hypothetical protein
MQQPPLDHNERPRTYAADIVHPATDSELADVAAQEFERINAEVLADTLYGSDKSSPGPRISAFLLPAPFGGRRPR